MATLRPLLLLLLLAAVSVNCQRRAFTRKIGAASSVGSPAAKQQRPPFGTSASRPVTGGRPIPGRTNKNRRVSTVTRKPSRNFGTSAPRSGTAGRPIPGRTNKNRRVSATTRKPSRNFGTSASRSGTAGRPIPGRTNKNRRVSTTTRKPSRNFGASRRTRPTTSSGFGNARKNRGRYPQTTAKPVRASNNRGKVASKRRGSSFPVTRGKQNKRKQINFRETAKQGTRGGFRNKPSSNKRPRFRGSPSQTGRRQVGRPNTISQAGTRANQPRNSKPKVDFNCPDVNGTYANTKQCDKYYRCVNGEASEELCPDGLLFHPDRLYPCVYPIEANCTTTRQDADSTDECPNQFATFRNLKDDCGSYTKCVAGVAHPSQCPQGLAFNSKTFGCEWADLVEECNDVSGYLGFRCPQRDFSADEVGDFTKEPHPTNCTHFYLCLNSESGDVVPRLQGCTDSMVFNKATKECTDQVTEAEGCEDAIDENVLAAFRQRQQDETDRRESRLRELKAKFFS